MGGLQARIVNFSEMALAARLDADFAAHPDAEWLDRLVDRPDFSTLSAVTQRVSSGHTPYLHNMSEGDVGFVTVECISSLRYHSDKLKRITSSQYQGELRDRQVKKGLVLSTIKRRICQAYPVLDHPKFPASVNQDVAILEPNDKISAAYLATYLSSAVGQKFADRQKTEQMNPYISLDGLRALPIHLATGALQAAVEKVLRIAYRELAQSDEKMALSEHKLASALGLSDWAPPEPLAYVASSTVAVRAGRFDAQFFSPRYDDLFAHIKATKQEVRLGDVLSVNARGNQPSYSECGIPVINSRHVRTNRIDRTDQRLATASEANILIKEGDLLLNGTGVGTIGRAAPYLDESPAIPDNHVTILRAEGFDPIYLSVFINSRIGQMQVERHTRGSSGQVELYPSDIAEFMIWRAPSQTQKSIRQCVLDAFGSEARAKTLLDSAKRAVEIAVEKNEVAALKHLKSVGA